MNIRRASFGRACGAAVVAVLATFASSGIAAADDISNNLDLTVDATAEVMALNVGGDKGTTTLRVVNRNGDGKNGCNIQGTTDALVASVASSHPAVATVAPGSVTFDDCADVLTLTVTPLSIGTTTISLTQTSNTSGGSFDLTPAEFTVNVAGPTNTAPTISVGGVDPGVSYNKGSVPAAICQVTDAEDGNSSFAATLTGTLDADGLGSQTASCTYTDGGGLIVSDSETYTIADPSAPVISYTLNPTDPDGLAGWYTGTVTLTWTVTETESPNSLNKSGCVNQTISTDQLNTTYSCSATSAGGSSGPVAVSVKRDGNGPAVSYTSATGTAGANGWYTSPVTATFTATDAFSGPTSQTGTNVSSGDGNAVTIPSPAFSDLAGNTTDAGVASSPEFKIDTEDPDFPTFVGGPEAGSSPFFGSVPAAPTCASDDETSGLATCLVSGYSTEVGSHTLTATATDKAGNTSTTLRHYSVRAWDLAGFYRPVDMSGVVNTVKAGSTVPLKFELFAATELTDVAAVKSFVVNKVTCDPEAVVDALENISTGGTTLRYDPTGGQFIQNWKTPTGSGLCYRATMTAQDGSTISALFKTK